jgi:hypothetical protein
VAADAFYQKGSSMGALLRIIEALPLMEQRDPLSTSIAAPLHIHQTGRAASGEACITIACPECLRTFPHLPNGSRSQIWKTNCTHCGSSIQYSDVEPLYRKPLESFQRRAGTAISTQGTSVVVN